MTIRPSLKLVYAAYALVVLLGLAVVAGWFFMPEQPKVILVLLAVPALFLVKAALRHIEIGATSATLAAGKLRYQSGILSKTTRMIQLPKIQDVRVDQSMLQRILGTGDLSIETAGETSRLTIPNVDRPRETAEALLESIHERGSEDERKTTGR